MKRYVIDTDKVLETVLEEVSRVAASAYAEEGVSLYDTTNITSKDFNVIQGLIDDAKNALLVRFSGIAYSHGDGICFDIPEERTHSMCVIAPVLDRFIAMNVCSAWMIQKYTAKAEEYGARSTDALEKAERLIYEKLPPIPPTHIEN